MIGPTELYCRLGDGHPWMYELEYKVPADHDTIRQQLNSRDVSDQGTVHQRDTYFDAPHRNFANTDEALRLRIETHGETTDATLTYKGPLLDTAAKTREERETIVTAPSELRAILEHLGFEPAATVEKHRHRYDLDEFTLSLDSVTGLGEYLELEAEAGSDGDLEALDRQARQLLTEFELRPEDHLDTSYLELLIEQRED